jgi:hypothetical protein
MVLTGEAQYSRQIVTISNSEGRVIAYDKPFNPMVNSLGKAFVLYDTQLHVL